MSILWGAVENMTNEGGREVSIVQLFLCPPAHFLIGFRNTPPKMSFGSMTAAKADYELPSPPSDGVSDLTFSPTGSLITAGSWDNGVSVRSTRQQCVSLSLFAQTSCVPHLLQAWRFQSPSVLLCFRVWFASLATAVVVSCSDAGRVLGPKPIVYKFKLVLVDLRSLPTAHDRCNQDAR